MPGHGTGHGMGADIPARQGGIMQGQLWDTIKVDIKATVAAALARDFP
jgi:hypothetical protein